MTKQDYTMYIYRADRRCKTGERLFSTTVFTNRDDNGMRREVAELFDLYPPSKGWRFEWFPTYKTVKNLMTGKDVQIDRDTPWSCNPASESYWSM
jgi:hypothetical protein